MDKEEIKKRIARQLPYLSRKYNVKKLGIFGSVVRNEQEKESDVDILVELASPIGFFDFIRLEDYLAKTLNQKVDLVTKKALKPSIKDDVLRDALYV